MTDATVPVPEVSLDELAEARDNGATVIDVREAVEYETGHVPGAALLPMSELETRFDEVAADQGRIYVICMSGGRSLTAAGALRNNGVDAVSVSGGTVAWVESGRPVVTGLDAG